MRTVGKKVFSVMFVLLMLLLSLGPAQAQEVRYFPETGHTLRGRFLQYWEQNGGLPVFGYPLTEERLETNSSGDQVTTQYFERQRFELHPQNARPYDVLLGRLGAELLTSRGTIPGADSRAGCRYYPETRHNVCNQATGRGLLAYWESHGLDFGDAGFSYRESLALFGYPLTEASMETNSSGDTVLTQWFERARLEWHPNNPDQYKVLQGRLGAEILPDNGDPPLFNKVTIYLIALEQGNVGCGDKLAPVERQVTPTARPLLAAMQELVTLDGGTVSGFYNVFAQSDLQVESATIDGTGKATVRLVGQLRLGGACDSPRVKATLDATARHFSSVKSTAFFVNGVPLDDVLSQR